MTVRRTQVIEALRARLRDIDLFPDVIDVDMEDDLSWRPLPDRAQHSMNILSGRFEGTRDAGPVGQWEGVRDVTVGYVVDHPDRDARAARRNQAVAEIEAMIAADRTLGLDDQVWAEIGDTTEDDDRPVADATACSVALVTINVTYVAASAAG